MQTTNKENKPSFIKDFLKSLISNERLLDASKKYPIWIGLIIGFLSIIIALVPSFVTLANTNGSQILSSYTFNLDHSLHEMCQTVDEGTLTLTNHVLSYSEIEADKVEYEVYSRTDKKLVDGQEKEYYDFICYFYNGKITSVFEEYITKGLLTRKYLVDTTTLHVGEDKEGESYYCPNYLILFTDSFGLVTYKSNTTTSAISSAGFDFLHTEGTDLIKILKGETKQATLNNFRKLLDESYLTVKNSTLWSTTGIYSGVFVGMIAVLGVMLFLMTRGKNNMFNYMKFGECEKISMWASFSPAVISLLLGFIISKYAMMFFILTAGMRAMWIAMKQLRPQ